MIHRKYQTVYTIHNAFTLTQRKTDQGKERERERRGGDSGWEVETDGPKSPKIA